MYMYMHIQKYMLIHIGERETDRDLDYISTLS